MILPQETNVCNSQQETIVRRVDSSAIKFISGLAKSISGKVGSLQMQWISWFGLFCQKF